MVRLFTILLIIFSLVSCLKLSANDSARVVRVKDGDTYVFRNGNKDYTIRLKNVDAPESKQQFGFQSTLLVSKLILGKLVIYDSTGTDMYKRVLADVWVDNMRLDSILVRNGWAWQYAQYSNDTILKNCMQLAFDEKKGLWRCGALAVCPPSLWRNYSIKDKNRYCNGCK